MNQLVTFMNSLTGRYVWGALGLALVALGLGAVHGTGGAVLAVAGVIPLVMGAWGQCLFEPFTTHRIA